MEPGVEPAYRLHSLYNTLIRYAALVTSGTEHAVKLGMKPSDIQKYKEISLDKVKVYRSIQVLARWRDRVGPVDNPDVDHRKHKPRLCGYRWRVPTDLDVCWLLARSFLF
jgi:hypothetical protein